MNEVFFSSKTAEWETPQDFFHKLNGEFHFTLDACANEKNHKCERYYSQEQDGLKQKWGGHVWCNPPYGKEVWKWVKKAYEESRNPGDCVVMLLPARTDTKWFHDWIYHRAEIRFVKGRLRFGNAGNGAPFPSMVVIFRGPGDS